MRSAIAVCLAAFAMATPGLAQTRYTSFTVSGSPFPTTVFGRAFTGGSGFRMVAADPAGNIYTNSSYSFFLQSQTIQRITPDGDMVPIAGFGAVTLSEGERVPALLTTLSPVSLAVDSQGNLFIAADRIYRVSPDGNIEVYAAVGSFVGNSMALDGAGNVYVAAGGARIVKIAPDRSITAFAGTGQFGSSGDGGAAQSAQISPLAIAADASGNVFLAEPQRLRKIDTNGTITTLLEVAAGAMTTDRAGNLYFVQGYMIRRLAPNGSVETVAGAPFPAPYRGDGGSALAAWLASPSSLAIDPAGNLFIANIERLRKGDPAGIIHTVAGCPCLGDGVPVSSVQVSSAVGIVRDGAGNVYFSDQHAHMVRRIAADGTLTTYAGNGESGFSGDGGPARAARLAWPTGLALDASGNLYIADTQNDRIRKVSAAGVIQTVAGSGSALSDGDGGPATSAGLSVPEGVAVDPAGNLYVADTGGHRIRKVTTDGTIRTIAGSDQWGTSGDGGPAVQAQLINPRMLALDGQGNLLFTYSSARMVRRITPAGMIARVAGTGQAGRTGDNGPAIAARLELPWGIAVDAAGDILISDGGVRMIDTAGVIHTLNTIFTSQLGSPSSFGVAAADAGGGIWIAAGTVAFLSPVGPPFPLGPELGGAGTVFATSIPRAVVSPGEIVTLAGSRLGPANAVSSPDTTGTVSTTLAGVRLLFDGVAAPVTAVESGAITAVAPYGIAGKATVAVTAEVNGLRSNTLTLAVLPVVPRLFTQSGFTPCFLGNTTIPPAAAVNENGRPNSFDGAPIGSSVSLFATGVGLLSPPAADGTILSQPPLPAPALPISVTSGNRQLEVTYAGNAPGMVAGAIQVNVRLSPGTPPTTNFPGVPNLFLPIELHVGSVKSAMSCLWVRQP